MNFNSLVRFSLGLYQNPKQQNETIETKPAKPLNRPKRNERNHQSDRNKRRLFRSFCFGRYDDSLAWRLLK